jgi:hypothetical protein
MPFVNLPPDLRVIFEDIKNRLRILETSTRFTAPIVATDPVNPRKGDIWINSTSNTAKIVDANGTVRTITWV